jgi:hypothetical protein
MWRYNIPKTKKGSDRRSAANHCYITIADTHYNRGNEKKRVLQGPSSLSLQGPLLASRNASKVSFPSVCSDLRMKVTYESYIRSWIKVTDV